MNALTRHQLIGERAFLLDRLAALPEAARLTRRSLEARLADIESELERLPAHKPDPARVRITFSGRPVAGSHGIFADFGAKAIGRFSDAVAAVAASITAPLAATGPIPGRDQNQLLITGTALGSFGFELEERENGQLAFDEQTPVATALERTQRLLRSSAEADDEELADAASGLDQRALDKVRHFVTTLAEDEAVCAVQLGERLFRFSDPGQVRRSLDRLSADNLREEELVVEGRFEGVLPTRRTFEFRGAGRELLLGRIAPAVADPQDINAHLNEAARVRLLMTRVGSGRPRYVLLEAPEWRRKPESG